MNSAMYRCRRPAASCCSRSSASATSAARLSSPAICHSTSGPACSGRRTRRDATIAERLLPRIRVIDAVHPLFGQPLEVSPSGLIRRIGWIQVVLPDGRHRWVPQKATDLNVSACEARPNRDLPLVSVRTLIPLAGYVRARLSALGERFDETSGHTADLGAEIVADDDADNTTTAGEAGGTATPVNAGRSRRRRFDRGASR